MSFGASLPLPLGTDKQCCQESLSLTLHQELCLGCFCTQKFSCKNLALIKWKFATLRASKRYAAWKEDDYLFRRVRYQLQAYQKFWYEPDAWPFLELSAFLKKCLERIKCLRGVQHALRFPSHLRNIWPPLSSNHSTISQSSISKTKWLRTDSHHTSEFWALKRYFHSPLNSPPMNSTLHQFSEGGQASPTRPHPSDPHCTVSQNRGCLPNAPRKSASLMSF